MCKPFTFHPIDYLIIGHLTEDVTPNGPVLGGTAAYAALTARSIGLQVGIVTVCSEKIAAIDSLHGIQISYLPSEITTTFENISTDKGRQQILHKLAPKIEQSLIPEIWKKTPIVHIAPVAQEIDPGILRSFPNAFIGLTPQGWLRDWSTDGKVHLTEWPEGSHVFQTASAAVCSLEDIGGNEERIEELVPSIRVLAITESTEGARLYWNGDLRRFRPHIIGDRESTGAGDIFAAAFFIRLSETRDPWEAARFATRLAAISATRDGIKSVPTPDEVHDSMIEISESKVP